MKKPTRLQIFFAQNWPIRLWLTAIPLLVLGVAIWACEPSAATFRSWQAAGLFLVAIIVAPPLGFFGGVLVGIFIFGPMYYSRGLLNGGPFKAGDTVQVLVGPHKGTVTTVYELWQGDSLRVRLGDREKEAFTDVFAPTQLLREDEFERPAGP